MVATVTDSILDRCHRRATVTGAGAGPLHVGASCQSEEGHSRLQGMRDPPLRKQPDHMAPRDVTPSRRDNGTCTVDVSAAQAVASARCGATRCKDAVEKATPLGRPW